MSKPVSFWQSVNEEPKHLDAYNLSVLWNNYDFGFSKEYCTELIATMFLCL